MRRGPHQDDGLDSGATEGSLVDVAADQFTCDVAFSFLTKDEPTAVRLNDILIGRASNYRARFEITRERIFSSSARSSADSSTAWPVAPGAASRATRRLCRACARSRRD